MRSTEPQKTNQKQGYWHDPSGDTTMDHYSSAQVDVLIVDDPFKISCMQLYKTRSNYIWNSRSFRFIQSEIA